MAKQAYLYRMTSGYCHTSSKRHPREPETIVTPDEVALNARFVGFATIDGCDCCAFRLGRRYYFQLEIATEKQELAHKAFSLCDVERGRDGNQSPRIYCDRSELIDAPTDWQKRGLTETASGYGSRLNSGLKIDFEGKARRIYVTCFSNAGTSWFMYRGEKIIVS